MILPVASLPVASLPNWADVDFLRNASLGVVAGLAAGGFIMLIIVRSLFSKILTLLVIAALAFGAIQYRTSLEHCLKTCSCKLASEKIPIKGHGCASTP